MKEFNVNVLVAKETGFDGQEFLEFNVPLLLLEKEEGMELYLTNVDVETTWKANEFDLDVLKYLQKQLRKVTKIDIGQYTDRLDAIKAVVNYEDFDAADLYTLDLTIKAVK